jgi:6,7-dimethyl-8-ribityllumazine synthase
MKPIKGDYLAKGKKFGIVVSDFNEVLTHRLLEGAVDVLRRHGAAEKHLYIIHVPGAFEIPLVAGNLIQKFKPDAVLTLSVVIEGQTKHFDQVVRETAHGIRELMKKTGVPVILGMIPAKNIRQAQQRVGIKQVNKGREWATAAIEMASLMRKLKTR